MVGDDRRGACFYQNLPEGALLLCQAQFNSAALS
jgi:hypothetical protein